MAFQTKSQDLATVALIIGVVELGVIDNNPYAAPQAASQLASRTLEIQLRSMVVRWVAGLSFVAFLIGAGSRLVRPFVSGAIHYEMLGVLVGMACLCGILVLRLWRFPLRIALLSVEVGLICMWSAQLLGWSLVHGSFWDDIAGVTLVCWLLSSSIAVGVTLIPHERHERPGPTRNRRTDTVEQTNDTRLP